ncbi:MAG: YqgE/AlgH family protein, partial [Bacteroidota bacterium]
MSKKKIEVGQVFIAQPDEPDKTFKNSVLLVAEYSEDGSLGFVLNKSLNMNINELISDFPEFDS